MQGHPIRLLILDVDGTIVTADKRLLPEVKLAVRFARECGLSVSLATGRMFKAVAGWAREMELDTPQICNNGADLIDPVSGRYVDKLTLDGAVAAQVLEFGRKAGVTIAKFSGDRVLVPQRTPDHWLIERNNEPIEVVSSDELLSADTPAEKVLFLDREAPGRVARLREELVRHFAHDGKLPFLAEITEPGILNICHPGASKAQALPKLCALLGIEREQVAAVGDSDNDAELLGMVGLGIAMGNATAAVRRAAKIQVPDNEQIGIVTAICEHVLQGVTLRGSGLLAVKLRTLRLALRGYPAAVVAFSGGVDSTLVLRLASEELGNRLLAVTARSAVLPPADFAAACALAADLHVRHLVVETDAQNEEWYRDNPPDRCYVCKKNFFTRLTRIAAEQGLGTVLDGENADDLAADRPGRLAAHECGVRSPLAEAGISKAEVRAISRELGLPNWDRPANACLATRFPRGDRLTAERLERVARAEEFLHGLGFGQLRVRVHGDLAVIEVPPADLSRLMERAAEIAHGIRSRGFRRVTLDLEGYRSGSMD